MGIPLELRRLPPGPTLAWVAGHFGRDAQVTAVRRIPNAWAAAVHAVDVDDGSGTRHDLVVRRWARTDLAPDPGVVENEAAALRLLASVREVRTPELVASDPAGECADVPAVLMTRLPGRDVLAPADLDRFLDELASALHAIHAVPVDAPAGGLGEYRPWGLESRDDPPPWSRRPDVWRRAFEIVRRPIPAYDRVLCHRDYHPGNVLWLHGQMTGVVDWTSTCLGPAAADVAHCRANLAILFGFDAAEEFARRYGPVADLAWFDIACVAGWSALETWRWHDAGRTDITDEVEARAKDEFLAAAVDRIS
jgi:aminoglycoside phosphotransferase (APT) family kinase protein